MLDCPPDADGSVEELGYGELKAGSERAVAAGTCPGRHLIVRPGLLVGPHENVGRLPWWLTRIARGGTVLAPGDPDRPVRMTDARDLAAWLVDNTRRGIPGVVNVPGPDGTTFGELLTACGEATGPAPRPAPAALGAGPGAAGRRRRAVDGAADVGAGHPGVRGLWDVTGDRALRTGIRYRPLSDTVRDTWAWLRRDAAARGGDWGFGTGPASAWTRPRSRRSWPAWADAPQLGRLATVSDRDDLLQMIKDKAVVHGDFVLSSGQRATWYIDLRRVLLSGRAPRWPAGSCGT